MGCLHMLRRWQGGSFSSVTILSKEQYLTIILLEIYDSANWLFNDPRWLGSDETFLPLLEDNEFLLAYEGSRAVEFLSYHKKCRGYNVIWRLDDGT